MNENRPTRGVIYVATGEQYISEAITSATSLKNHMKAIDIVLYSNNSNINADCFDEVKTFNETRGDYGDSIITPDMLQFDRTIFLDTDTYVCSDISELFELLNRFDIAASHNPGSRITRSNNIVPAEGVPQAFPLYNTGVIALRNNAAVNNLLQKWMEVYNVKSSQSNSKLNQPAFRQAVYHSDVEIATLPSEYNCRIKYSGTAGFLADEAKIIHGRHSKDLSEIAKILNKDTGVRVFSFNKYPIEIRTASPSLLFYIMTILAEKQGHHTYKNRFVNSIRNRGVLETINKIITKIKN